MSDVKAYVLLVEDDESDRSFFLESIKMHHPEVEVKISLNGHQALTFLAACAKENLPTIIILDYDMPWLDGAEILFHLAAVPSLAAIPKVIWSESDRHFWRCKALGVKEYFVKASSVQEMTAIVGRIAEMLQRA